MESHLSDVIINKYTASRFGYLERVSKRLCVNVL